jgi:hypothetical protein
MIDIQKYRELKTLPINKAAIQLRNGYLINYLKGHVKKGDMPVDNKYLKRSSVSLAIRKK